MAVKVSRYVSILSVIVLIIALQEVIFSASQEHTHSHSHGTEEPPSFKYSQQANDPGADINKADGPPNGHQHSHSHSHNGGSGHGHSHGGSSGRQKDSGAMLWLWALGSTALVSCAPVLILLFIPLDHTQEKQPLLKVLLSFASGGLLGDAFLHLIPHAISPHSHSGEHTHSHSHSHGNDDGHSHSHDMSVGLWVLGGIVAFLIVEKFVRYVKGGHGHSHGPVGIAVKDDMAKHKKTDGDDESEPEEKKDTDSDTNSAVRQRKMSEGKDKEENKSSNEDEGDIKVAGYLNLAADFTHNFTDGLAIGASYLAGRNVGIITTVTILLHEVPHEVGDFAILVQSGCSKKKAMMLQFSTALGAMTGTLCSLMAEGIGDAAVAWILPFTAGGFIYIATVSVIPELLEDSKIWQSVKEIAAMFVGILMMVVIAELE